MMKRAHLLFEVTSAQDERSNKQHCWNANHDDENQDSLNELLSSVELSRSERAPSIALHAVVVQEHVDQV